jgi:hypothetical protein
MILPCCIIYVVTLLSFHSFPMVWLQSCNIFEIIQSYQFNYYMHIWSLKSSCHLVYLLCSVSFFERKLNNNSHIISVGCWCDPGYLSVGFWWWSQSSLDAQKSASCQMGWWCWIGIDCHCYRSACSYISTLMWLLTTCENSTNIWNWLQEAGLFRDSKNWVLKSLGRYQPSSHIFISVIQGICMG